MAEIEKIVGMIIGLVILGSAAFVLLGGFETGNTAINLIEGLEKINDNCKKISNQILDGELEAEWIDLDNDNFYDGCDICKGADNNNDQDFDGIPDLCDKEYKNPRVVECKNGWNKEESTCKI